MIKNVYLPEYILSALKTVEDELITLVGENWSQIANKYNELKQSLSDESRKLLASVEIIELFSPYEVAQKKIMTAIIRQDEVGDILLMIADIIPRLNINPQISTAITEAIQPSNRMRHILVHNIDEVRSFKLGNIKFELGEMHILGTAIMTIVADKFAGTNAGPLIIAVGILSIAQKLIKEMTVKFDEREATVFYGFAKIVGDDKIATECEIQKAANSARDEIGLNPLDSTQLRNALHQLEKLKTVELVSGKNETWCIKENFCIKR